MVGMTLEEGIAKTYSDNDMVLVSYVRVLPVPKSLRIGSPPFTVLPKGHGPRLLCACCRCLKPDV